ncbi:hypothetical protein [Leclercia adecarboxylata]
MLRLFLPITRVILASGRNLPQARKELCAYFVISQSASSC